MNWYKTAQQVDPNAGFIVYDWPGEGQITAEVVSVDTQSGFYLVNHRGRELRVYPQQVLSVQPKDAQQQPQMTFEQWQAIGQQNGWL